VAALIGQGEISVDLIREALELARSLLDGVWLVREFAKQPSDPLLMTRRTPITPGQQIHRIRYEQDDLIHPLAEAVLAAEEVLAEYQTSGLLRPSIRIYLLLSLRDVGLTWQRIANAETRLARLSSIDWHAALYELLVAASYLEIGDVALLPEGATPTPDIRVETDQLVYVECKAKTQHEEQVGRFLRRWREQALGAIADLTKRADAGLLVKVVVKKDGDLSRIPVAVEEMVRAGETARELRNARISIEPFESGSVQPPVPMSLTSSEFWKWAMGFDEDDDWHFVLPGGNFQFSSVPHLIVKEVARPTLICVRAEWLSGTTQDVYGPLKEACRKQLRVHQPGILHMKINTALFALGVRGNASAVKEVLLEAAEKIFRDYSRVSQIYYDIVSPPVWGTFGAATDRLGLTNKRAKSSLNLPGTPQPILLL